MYLTGSYATLQQEVVKHQLKLAYQCNYSILQEVRQVTVRLPYLSMTNTGVQFDGEPACTQKVVSMLKTAQYEALKLKRGLSQKIIHGVF